MVLSLSCQRNNPISFPNYFPQENRVYFNTVRLETIELGKKLFFDTRLSSNNQISCASCHLPERAFTDGKKISEGIFGRHSRNNASTLLNVGFSPTFMFDMRAHDLEIQPMIPIHDTNEMNMDMQKLEKKLKKDITYHSLSKRAYMRPLDANIITKSLAAYMKSLISSSSKYDRFLVTEDSSLFSLDERNGKQLFFGKGKCNDCHTAPLFTNYNHYNLGLEDSIFGAVGKMGATHNPLDRARYKTPTLRNIELTYPYFHDGRSETLYDAIDEHIRKERKTRDYHPVNLSNTEKKDLIAFLKTLTDINYKNSPYLQAKK